MPTTADVARFIVSELGSISAMKLQKLIYYAQAWNLVWEEEPLFDEDFEAWANGPVLPDIYHRHRGMFLVNESMFLNGDAENLSESHKHNIRKVLDFYGKQTAQWLSDLTHQESPWKDARDGAAPGAFGSNTITKAAMHEYYSSL